MGSVHILAATDVPELELQEKRPGGKRELVEAQPLFLPPREVFRPLSQSDWSLLDPSEVSDIYTVVTKRRVPFIAEEDKFSLHHLDFDWLHFD